MRAHQHVGDDAWKQLSYREQKKEPRKRAARLEMRRDGRKENKSLIISELMVFATA